MAKRQIKNYVFRPGIGINGNRYPNAWALIDANKEFIKKEVTAWIGRQVADGNSDFLFNREKCIRDLEYIADNIAYDVAFGTNFNAVFQGKAETYSLEVSGIVINSIIQLQGRLRDLSSVKADATALARLNSAFDTVLNIAQNGRLVAPQVTFTDPDNANATQIAAKNKLVANRTFIVAEAGAYLDVTYSGNTIDNDAFAEQMGYIVDSVTYDVIYGGNSRSRDVARFLNTYVNIAEEDRAKYNGVLNQIKSVMSDVVQGNSVTPSTGNTESQDTSGSNADAATGTTVSGLVQISQTVINADDEGLLPTETLPGTSWIAAGVEQAFTAINANSDSIVALVSPAASYTYDSDRCLRDTGLNVDAYLHDLRYGGNQETYRIANTYWEGDVAQVDGYRTPEVRAKEFTRDLINNNILTNTPQPSPYQTQETQVIDLSKTAEFDAGIRIQTLVNLVRDVIRDGTSALPTLEYKGLGHIRFAGNYNAPEILLITNATKNTVIYNFSDPLKGGVTKNEKDTTPRDSSGYVIKYDDNDANQDRDDDFPKYLQTTDAITVIDLVFDTDHMSDGDEIQIFVEDPEIRTRPYDFGTDAIERMRIAPPLSMLDADFEYGLQPTKWSAIATMRGYPSVYELPGTDTQVRTVITDGSVGTQGIGASKITVTTQGRHGFIPGTPITIKALEDSVLGASRAEGTFVITETPTDTTFTYFAKAKVGNQNDVLSTTYTQLRQGAFYTGAALGDPEFAVISDGTAGNMTLTLAAQTGENRLAFTGDVPEIGAPIVYADIPTGAQVTAIASTPDGNALVPTTTQDVNIGATQINVEDVAGFVVGLAVDNGDGDALFVTNIAGNTITLSGAFTQAYSRNSEDYVGVSGTVNVAGGTNAEFNINKAGIVYSITGIAQPGTSYQAGDKIKILGSDIGGQTPANDAIVTVTTVNGTGGVTAADIEGTALSGAITYSNVTNTFENQQGTAPSQVDLVYENGSYTSMTIQSPNDSTGFIVGDRIYIEGNQVDPIYGISGNQNDGGNDIVAKVTAVGAGGSITTLEIDQTDWALGTPPAIERTYSSVAFSGGTGTSADISVTVIGTEYTIIVQNGGTGYTTADTLVVSGVDLGGTSPDNDLYIRVNAVDGSGGITSYRLEGADISSLPVAFNGGTIVAKTPQVYAAGSGAQFDVTNDGSVYTVAIDAAGSGYFTGQTFTVAGDQLGGATPANDATITVDTVLGGASVGALDTISITGTPIVLANNFNGVAGTTQPNNGAGATFTVTRSGGTYTIAVDGGGADYEVGNTIVIDGTALGGATPANDATFTVGGVGGSGDILNGTITGSPIAGDNISFVNAVTMSEFTTASITSGETIPFEALATIEVTMPNGHGIVPGDTFTITIDSDDADQGGTNNHNLMAGSFIAINIPEVHKVRYNARSVGSIDDSVQIQGNIYLRPDSFFIHRPYDGGVQLGTGGPQHGAQAIRQSKKYIRYQSGKGIMYTTGALFAPSYDLRTVEATGTEIGATITCTCDDNDHGMQVGGAVRLIGVETEGYNGNYVVSQVIDERTFKIQATRRLGSINAILGFAAQVAVTGWHGATVRSGIFDDQNGIYWEYDGTNIQVAQRTSTKQIAGTVTITPDSNLVTGNNTRFRDQLKAGDRIVIRGMTHVVSNVNSQTELTMTPDYRGVNPVGAAKVCLVSDKKVKQDQWNLDRCDGTGPSGYDMDVSYMQMIGIQYSWYGAGFIDWMLRGADGNFVFCHRMRNSNVNTEAFMRSGNLPVRYEVTNEGANGKLASDITSSQTTIPLEDARFFPISGTVYIDNEIVNFTNVNYNTNELTGCTRGGTLQNFQSGALRQYSAGNADSHIKRTGVVLISNTITPLISHWGSAFITDGMFDEDRGYIFSYTETQIPVSTTRQTAFLLRLAPSVSNAIVGDLGDRELLNRAQLLMQEMEITSDGEDDLGNTLLGGIVIEGILNPQNYPLNPADVGWQGLSGLAQGGQPSFAQVASGGTVNWSTGDTSTTATATVIPRTNVSAQMLYSIRRRNYAYFEKTSWEAANLSVGDEVDDNKFTGGTTITQITEYTSYYFVRFSSTSTSNLNAGANVQFAIGGDDTNRAFALFTQDSWEAAGAIAGTELDDPPTDQVDISFPSGTYVSNVTGPFLFGNPDSPGNFVRYYKVFFNNSATGTVQAGDLFNFVFRQPPYAQPGETVFSFIATPGERSVLDLSTLKELTNTTLGGRGTFPNGPDVLAINVYKTSGAAANANIIIKWGEAQA